MIPARHPQVSVIIACHNAEDTLLRAIRSALAESETSEVLVIDDASTDGSMRIACAESERDPRVRPTALDRNEGPAAARNRGIELASAPYVAPLDSDDFFLPGRLRLLLSGGPCEMIADNIAFITPLMVDEISREDWSGIESSFETLEMVEFVRGNLRRRDTARGELGFLKPILDREFMNANGLRYDSAMRLGEDYDLYCRMMLSGARLRLTRYPGYAAVVRSGSLSAGHDARDLATLHDRIKNHLRSDGLPAGVAQAIRALAAEVRHKRDHRMFLDIKRAEGPAAALRYAMGGRNRVWPIGAQIARDKLGLSHGAGDAAEEGRVRLLL